jgi:hypothetical protein
MALKTQGIIFKRAGVEVAEIEGFNGPDGEATEIPATHLRSEAMEYLQGLADEGNISFTAFLKPGDAAQAGMRQDRDSQVSNTYSPTLTDAAATTLTFTAFCKQFAISAQPNDAIKVSIGLRITGKVVWS